MSTLPRITIASATVAPTLISFSGVRLMYEGDRMWKRNGAGLPSLTM